MIHFSILAFWTGVTIVMYTYLGYGLILLIISKIKKPFALQLYQTDSELPSVTILIPAYNEDQLLEEKIRNTQALDYPADKLHIAFVTDGSTDNSPKIIKQHAGITLFHSSERKGKIHAVNRVMKMISTPIIVFCDANTLLNSLAIKNIVRHYQDANVGGVAGEKRIFKKTADNASGAGEGLYWKYESFLKKKDSDINSVVGAAGELFSIRTSLYEEPAEDMIIEDFYMSLRIAARGYRFVYEPESFATEAASASVKEEWKRKVRICAGAFQAMGKLIYLLNPFKYGLLSFQYLSHRVLRWTLAPISLLVILLSNLALAFFGSPIYIATLSLQILFYCIAYLGYLNQDKDISLKGFFVPYYFTVMNLAVYAGLTRFIKGKQSVVWEKAERAKL